MTKKDFFRILIKAIGINLLIGVIIGSLPVMFYPISGGYDLQFFIPIIGILVFGIIIYHFLISNTDILINAFKLDKGFDDDTLNLTNFNFEKMVQLGLIIVSLFLLTSILKGLTTTIQYMIEDYRDGSKMVIFATLIQFGFAFLILVKSKEIAKFLSK